MNLLLREDLNPDNLKEISDLGWSYTELKNPGDGRSFSKGNIQIWRCIHKDYPSWARAEIVSQHYTNHHYYVSLMDAIKDVNGEARGKY